MDDQNNVSSSSNTNHQNARMVDEAETRGNYRAAVGGSGLVKTHGVSR